MQQPFAFDGSASSFASLAAYLQGRLSGNVIYVKTPNLSGEVKLVVAGRGISLINWTLTTREAYTLPVLFTPAKCNCLLVYNFKPSYDTIHDSEGGASFEGGTPSVLSLSGTAHLDFIYPAQVAIRCTTIVLTKKWLGQQLLSLKSGQPQEGLMDTLPPIAYRPLFKSELSFAKELYQELQGSANGLLVRTAAYNLLSIFYRHHTAQTRRSVHHRDHSIIWQVEKELVQNLCGAPPSIDELARQFFLSPSTLQRHFKSVFGTNAYEYYLRKKMEEAKKLLKAGHTVNTVSYSLGYESVSHFIRIFKKMIGENPGKHKKGG